ncbi:replication initiation protein RepC [Agrobacterium genomosp. 3]|jgi:replication initiation protein RepC|uniref:plasmid replication protein RepC n=1 Tax=Agrobacterium TaxID=357 RepID=UPI000DB2CC0F|nr:replication initiation protein RepC [Agrobacterium tomkonis]MCA1878315.1 replication initiation protein RepC [Agrobacterium tumefaciens]MCA1893567.1 replication initiation protein RepC [Agrobacterium tomkonis]PZU69109.1 MAG: replication initiation protein RepC [Rhizobium sp.]
MRSGSVTTPFGRRPMTLALVRTQFQTADIRKGKVADKWKVYRDACEARALLGLRDRALAVLNALLSFYPETDLSEDANLVVFPSNAQLSARANGIAGTTLRENLAVLVGAGLINRNDSPNGKRYVRRGKDGEVETAYGFSLAPLLARAEELALMAQRVAEEARRFKVVKERTTIARRDVRKLITAAVEDGAPGDWATMETIYLGAVARLRTAKSIEALESIMDELELLREGVLSVLESNIFSQKTATNDNEIRQHIQNSNTESINEFEPSSEKEQGEKPMLKSDRLTEPLKSFPIGLVMRACPEIAAYAPGGQVQSWRDLMSAAVVVRSTLGVSASAYQDACEAMGAENAAVTMAAILERAGHINSAGGYLRDLTSRTRRGEFSLGPMIMALLKVNSGGAISA